MPIPPGHPPLSNLSDEPLILLAQIWSTVCSTWCYVVIVIQITAHTPSLDLNHAQTNIHIYIHTPTPLQTACLHHMTPPPFKSHVTAAPVNYCTELQHTLAAMWDKRCFPSTVCRRAMSHCVEEMQSRVGSSSSSPSSSLQRWGNSRGGRGGEAEWHPLLSVGHVYVFLCTVYFLPEWAHEIWCVTVCMCRDLKRRPPRSFVHQCVVKATGPLNADWFRHIKSGCWAEFKEPEYESKCEGCVYILASVKVESVGRVLSNSFQNIKTHCTKSKMPSNNSKINKKRSKREKQILLLHFLRCYGQNNDSF